MSRKDNSALLAEEAKWWEQFTQMKDALAAAGASGEGEGELPEFYGKDLLADSDDDEEDSELTEDMIRHRRDIVGSTTAAGNEAAAPQGNLRGARLLNRSERDERLRRMDEAHKSAPLRPQSYSSEPQYPHVYRAHNAGNTLN